MAVLRRVARPLLAATFIRDGLAAVREPARPDVPEDSGREREASALASRVPFLPEDPAQLARLQGAVQLGAGVLLALGRAPRLASAALAVTLVSSTLTASGDRAAGKSSHEDGADEEDRARRVEILTKVSLFGGLLIAAADTHGKPSLAYRTRRTASHASDALSHRAQAVTHQVGNAAGATVDSVTHSVEAARKRLS
ncbi:DoxX family protein [Streptomyces sp. NPDC049916]|uniref:DoxX family protein n=1 Tax=Streptomyces sp. NPDC049916 TaxID=3155156 RepID=UPI003419B520